MAEPAQGDGRRRALRDQAEDRLGRAWPTSGSREDRELDRDVAIKILHDRFAQDKEFVERFRREAQSAAGLQHPNVVSIFDRGEFDDTYFIAMEYVEGPS